MADRPRTDRPDQGVTLVLVLVFLALTGLFGVALLSQAISVAHDSAVVAQLQSAVAAANGGVEYGIQVLQADSTVCAGAGGGLVTLPGPGPIDGQTVAVSCQTFIGGSAGAAGWAVITNDPGTGSISDLSDQGGQPKTITGPVFNNGTWSLKKVLTVNGGNVVTAGAGCSVPIPNLAVAAPFTSTCQRVQVPQVAAPLAATPPPVAPAPSTSRKCTVLYPGTYTATQPVPLATLAGYLGGSAYLVSGLYYFDNLGALSMGSVFGGAPSPPEVQQTSGTPCSSDPKGTNGTGVEVIAGGNTQFQSGNSSDFEVFTRVPAQADGSIPGFSLYQLPPGTAAPWDASSLPSATQFLSAGNGAQTQMVVHGALYAPGGSVGIQATNTAWAVLEGGADVWDLALQSSASASGLVVSNSVATGSRYTVVTATATGPAGGKPITSRAVVQVANDGARTVSVQSWRTCSAARGGPAGQCVLS